MQNYPNQQGYPPAGNPYPTGNPYAQSAPGYTYSEHERVIPREIASHIRFLSIVWIICGALGVLGALGTLATQGIKGLGSLVACVGLLAQAFILRSVQERFASIGRMEGGDVPQTLAALADLNKYYTVMLVVTAIQLLTTIVGLF